MNMEYYKKLVEIKILSIRYYRDIAASWAYRRCAIIHSVDGLTIYLEAYQKSKLIIETIIIWIST